MQPILHQPEPKPPKHPYASFLRDFVEPVPDLDSGSDHSLVSESLESVGSDREKGCRSDSHLYYSNDDLISRQLTSSETKIGYTKDADGFPKHSSLGKRPCLAHTDGQVGIIRAEQDSPDLAAEIVNGYIDRLRTLQRWGTEADVEEFFNKVVFPNSDPAYK